MIYSSTSPVGWCFKTPGVIRSEVEKMGSKVGPSRANLETLSSVGQQRPRSNFTLPSFISIKAICKTTNLSSTTRRHTVMVKLKQLAC